MRATRRQPRSGQQRPAWPGNAMASIRSCFPFEEHTSYTAAAVILAADAIAGAGPASRIFASHAGVLTIATVGRQDSPMMRVSLLDNPVARTVFSAWSWLVLGVLLIVWVPARRGRLAGHRAVRPRPLCGRLDVPQDRRCPPGAQPAVALPHPRADAPGPAAALRRRRQPRELRRHPADLPPAVGDEVVVEGRVLQVPVDRLADADGRRHPSGARQPGERRRGHAGMRGPPRQTGVRDDLPGGHPLDGRRTRTVPARRLQAGDRQPSAGPAARRPRHPRLRCASTTGGSACPTPTSTCSIRSTPRG